MNQANIRPLGWPHSVSGCQVMTRKSTNPLLSPTLNFMQTNLVHLSICAGFVHYATFSI